MSELGGWAQLETKGWKKIYDDITKKTHFIRPGPNGKQVTKKRQLSKSEKEEIGHILFPAVRRTKNVNLIDFPLPGGPSVSQSQHTVQREEEDIVDCPEVNIIEN